MKTRIRQLGPSRWVVEAAFHCCDWMMVDPQLLVRRMPNMPYEDWFILKSEEAAIEIEKRFKSI